MTILTDYIRTPQDDANDAAEAAWKRRRNADSLRALQSRLAREARQRFPQPGIQRGWRQA